MLSANAYECQENSVLSRTSASQLYNESRLPSAGRGRKDDVN